MNNKGVYCQRAVLSFFLIVYFKGPKWFVVTDNCYWTWHSFNTVKPTLNVCLTSRFTHTLTSHSLAYLMTMLLHCLLYSSIPIFATSSGPLIFRDLSISYSWKTSTITERNQTTVSLTSSVINQCFCSNHQHTRFAFMPHKHWCFKDGFVNCAGVNVLMVTLHAVWHRRGLIKHLVKHRFNIIRYVTLANILQNLCTKQVHYLLSVE